MTTILLVLARALHIGSAMLLVSLPLFTVFILRPGRAPDRFDHDKAFCRRMVALLWAALTAEIVSGAAWLWLVAAEMCDESPWDELRFAELETVLFQTSFGRVWICRGVILVIIAALLGWLGKTTVLHRSTPHAATWLFLGLSGGLLATIAWAGHAGSGAHWHFWHLFVDIVHLGAGAIWPVGLLPLAVYLGSSLRAAGGFAENDVAVAQRFSRASLVAVLVLLGSGVINSCLMLPSWNALFTSTYGGLLLGKILVVTIMIGLGAFNRTQLLPMLQRGAGPRLLRTVAVESILVLVVLLIVGLMGITPPGS